VVNYERLFTGQIFCPVVSSCHLSDEIPEDPGGSLQFHHVKAVGVAIVAVHFVIVLAP
jgi:hypothetical protein